MRKPCLSYLTQSQCGREEWHSTDPERWVQEKANICWALQADVTFLSSLAFQTQILRLLPTQEAPGTCGVVLTFIFTELRFASPSLFQLMAQSLYSPSGVQQEIRYLWSMRRKLMVRIEQKGRWLRKLLFFIPAAPKCTLQVCISKPPVFGPSYTHCDLF